MGCELVFLVRNKYGTERVWTKGNVFRGALMVWNALGDASRVTIMILSLRLVPMFMPKLLVHNRPRRWKWRISATHCSCLLLVNISALTLLIVATTTMDRTLIQCKRDHPGHGHPTYCVTKHVHEGPKHSLARLTPWRRLHRAKALCQLFFSFHWCVLHTDKLSHRWHFHSWLPSHCRHSVWFELWIEQKKVETCPPFLFATVWFCCV